jgi:hypothetical protein
MNANRHITLFPVLLMLLLMGAIFSAPCAAAPVTLRSEVEVSGAKISLADLLPSGSERISSLDPRTIFFGDAPQPGKTRVLSVSEVRARLAECKVPASSLVVSGSIHVRRAGYALSLDTVRDRIAAFLKEERSANNGSSEAPENALKQNSSPRLSNLQIPAGLMAREKDPQLEVTSIRRDAFSHDLLIHLRCRRRAVCGSFLVLASPALGLREFSLRNFSDSILASRWEASRKAVSRRSRSSAPVLVQPGKSAMLVLQGQGMRITLPVICLQRGSLAQQVAVRDSQTRTILQAKVVGPGQLQSAF